MCSRLSLLIVVLLLLSVPRVALADDESDIAKLLAQQPTTLLVSGSWAMADIGSIERGTIELVVLRRYKGEWRRLSSPSSLSRGELLALGVPEQATYDFGLGEVPEKVVSGLRNAVEDAKLHHKSFNIVTFQNYFFGYTSNDPKNDGFQVWISNGGKWQKLFFVKPHSSQAEIDKVFDEHHIPRFIEYRILVGRGTTQ